MKNKELQQSDLDSLMMLFSNEEFEKGLVVAQDLIEMFPNNALLHNINGAFFSSLGSASSAIESYIKAIAIDPLFAKAYYNLAGVYHDQDQLDKSIKNYE